MQIWLFIALLFATEHSKESNEPNTYSPILVKIEEDEYAKGKVTKAFIYSQRLCLNDFFINLTEINLFVNFSTIQ